MESKFSAIHSGPLRTVETFVRDLRYSARSLRRDAGFAIFAVLIIGLGVGASASVFSVLNGLLWKPLPLKQPSNLVWIANKADTEDNMSGRTVQVIPMLKLRERNRSFDDIAAYFAFYSPGDVRMAGQGEPERLTAVPVSEKFFSLLGVQPQIGRQFTSAECQWHGPKAAILSYGLWNRRFGRDPHIVNQALRLDDQVVTVVGTLPASFDFGAMFAPGAQIDLFYPFPLARETDRWGNTLLLIGRLKPGTALGSAQAEADTLGNQITAEDRRRNSLHPRLMSLTEHVSGRVRPALFILACAVAVVMLIVCANLSSLLLARAAARQREMAIRAALGAGRAQLVRQVLTEALILTSSGALLGILVAYATTYGIAHLTAFNLPLLSSVRVDGQVLTFAVLIAMATCLILGLAPA